MNSAALVFALAVQVFTAGPLPQGGQLDVQYDLDVEVVPDVVPRGRTTTIVVSGAGEAPLKTLRIVPADGVTLGPITPLSPRAGGRSAVSVAVTVSATAMPGERAVTLTTPPEISGTDSVVRSGDQSRSKEIDQLFESIIARETKPRQVASLTINSHTIQIVSARLIPRGSDLQVEIRIDDPASDFAIQAPARRASNDLFVVVDDNSVPVISEANCGADIFVGLLGSVRTVSSSAGSTVLLADVELPVDSPATCELRLRVRDRQSNLSGWFSLPLSTR
jgi:hypothetical protein